MGFALSGMQLTSTTFDQGGAIPCWHRGEGEEVSPEDAGEMKRVESKRVGGAGCALFIFRQPSQDTTTGKAGLKSRKAKSGGAVEAVFSLALMSI